MDFLFGIAIGIIMLSLWISMINSGTDILLMLITKKVIDEPEPKSEDEFLEWDDME